MLLLHIFSYINVSMSVSHFYLFFATLTLSTLESSSVNHYPKIAYF